MKLLIGVVNLVLGVLLAIYVEEKYDAAISILSMILGLYATIEGTIDYAYDKKKRM